MTKPRLSGYSVTYNCIDYSAPFSASIRSLLGFCDEVVVVDAGSTDGTIDVLKEIARADGRLRVVEDSVDFSHPRWGLHLIGELKARARLLCRGEYLWEMDTDEVVSAQEYPKIAQAVANMALSTNDALVLALPVAYFWGDSTNLRTDIAVWRPRLTRNDARITHGVSSTARETDELGNYFPRLLGPPTIQDAISYTWLDLESNIPPTFPEGYNQIQDLRIHSLVEYLTALEDLPIVLNLRYLNLNRALHQCKSFLPGLYTSIFKDHNFDTSEWNPIFKKPWAVVSDEEIAEGALRLKELGPVQLISRGLEIGVKSFAHHQLKIPQSVKDWHREFFE